MNDPLFTVIMPTLGRQSLPFALNSCLQQNVPTEVLVVADGWEAYVRAKDLLANVPRAADGNEYALIPIAGEPANDWGHSIRHMFGRCARGEWVCWVDDDGQLAVGALAQVAFFAKDIEPQPSAMLANVDVDNGNIVPGDREEVICGRLDGMGLIVQRATVRALPWPMTKGYEGDWAYYQELQRYGYVERIPVLMGRHNFYAGMKRGAVA